MIEIADRKFRVDRLPQYGIPLSWHHAEGLMEEVGSTYWPGQIMNSEKRTTDWVDGLHSNSGRRYSKYGQDNHTYKEDVFGFSGKQIQQAKKDLAAAQKTYLDLVPDVKMLLVPFTDLICGACAIGDHCRTGFYTEYIRVLSFVDWLRASRVVAKQLSVQPAWYGRWADDGMRALLKIPDPISLIRLGVNVRSYGDVLPGFGVQMTARTLAFLYDVGFMRDRNSLQGKNSLSFSPFEMYHQWQEHLEKSGRAFYPLVGLNSNRDPVYSLAALQKFVGDSRPGETFAKFEPVLPV